MLDDAINNVNYKMICEIYNLIKYIYSNIGIDLLSCDSKVRGKELEWQANYMISLNKDIVEYIQRLNEKIKMYNN